MSNTTYAGIDYGGGITNIDLETGIRYGVISQNSLSGDALNDMESMYGDPRCPECGGEVVESSTIDEDSEEWQAVEELGKDWACVSCLKVWWSDACFPEEAAGLEYEGDGYKLESCLDTDIMILKSPYYTYAQFCSPCVPGAGNLDCPLDVSVTTGEWTVENELAAQARTNNKTYCLGPEWFDEYSPMPYKRMWRVEDGVEVKVKDGEVVNE